MPLEESVTMPPEPGNPEEREAPPDGAADRPPNGGRGRKGLSVQTSAITLVAAANLIVFATGLAWVTTEVDRQAADRDSTFEELIGERIEHLLDTQGNLRAETLLAWARWDRIEDAMVVHLPDFDPDRDTFQTGLQLNPTGSVHRLATFDDRAILEDIESAARARERVRNERGIAVPLRLPSGRVWGGCWFRVKTGRDMTEVMLSLLPWFLVSTLLLTLFTFSSMSRLVLDPVRDLARAVRKIASGDFGVRVHERVRRDEISELGRGFNAMADQVEGYNKHLSEQVELATRQAREAEAAAMTQRRLAATGELAAGIAHEINNPLGGMLNAVDVLGREDLEPQRREQYLDLVRGGLERIRGTVGRVLRLAPRASRAEPTAMAGPLVDALGLIEHRAKTEGIEVCIHSGTQRRMLGQGDPASILDGQPPVLGEANELGQAILNLLVNALDALESCEGGRVDIRLEQRGSEMYLAVADDGPGMTPEVLARAADLFFTTKDTGKGTGLGLAIVHNVVAAHGGRVNLGHRAGGGLEVEVYLPVIAS